MSSAVSPAVPENVNRTKRPWIVAPVSVLRAVKTTCISLRYSSAALPFEVTARVVSTRKDSVSPGATPTCRSSWAGARASAKATSSGVFIGTSTLYDGRGGPYNREERAPPGVVLLTVTSLLLLLAVLP